MGLHSYISAIIRQEKTVKDTKRTEKVHRRRRGISLDRIDEYGDTIVSLHTLHCAREFCFDKKKLLTICS